MFSYFASQNHTMPWKIQQVRKGSWGHSEFGIDGLCQSHIAAGRTCCAVQQLTGEEHRIQMGSKWALDPSYVVRAYRPQCSHALPWALGQRRFIWSKLWYVVIAEYCRSGHVNLCQPRQLYDKNEIQSEGFSSLSVGAHSRWADWGSCSILTFAMDGQYSQYQPFKAYIFASTANSTVYRSSNETVSWQQWILALRAFCSCVTVRDFCASLFAVDRHLFDPKPTLATQVTGWLNDYDSIIHQLFG